MNRRNLDGAAEGNVVVRDEGGVCLASYRTEGRYLRWAITDECAAEQLAVMLPRTAAYATRMLDWLFRGALVVTLDGGTVTVTSNGAKLGAGKVYLVGEDSKGKRWGLGEIGTSGADDALGTLAVGETDMRKIVAVYHGVDRAGEEIVAIGQLDLTAAPSE